MTTPMPQLVDLVRNFLENGMKLLLLEGLNLRELLTLGRSPFTADLDYRILQYDPTVYVQRDYRHIESDMVLRVPLRRARRRSRLVLWLYILIEHQSEPDRFMLLRLLDYDIAIYKAQVREWLRTHSSLAGLQLMPVLPVVLYTGLDAWPAVGRFASLLAGGDRFADLAPQLEPLFVPVRDLSAAQLAAGGAFGQVMRLLRARRAPLAEFRGVLESVVAALEGLPARQRARWQLLMSYLHAMMYHERNPQKHAELQDHIERAVRSERHRHEVNVMGKTIADMFIEQGREQGRKQGELLAKRSTLLNLLHLRFPNLPTATSAVVEACEDVAQLDAWINAFVTARTLAQIGIR